MLYIRVLSGLLVLGTIAAQGSPRTPLPNPVDPGTEQGGSQGTTRNAILFVGDGMGISTLTAARLYSVGSDGQLAIDQLPFTALSRVYAGDYLTPDSASTMSSMVTGQKGNMGVIAMDASTEAADFNGDGDGANLTTLIELAKAAGKKVGIVTTDELTGATPAACYAHLNNRTRKSELILQALPTDPTYNTALGTGVDLLVGGGRGYCVPDTLVDEEGAPGFRSDGRDLRAEFQTAGYSYIWNDTQWYSNPAPRLPLIALFDWGPMDYEFDRHLDVGGNPDLSGMVLTAMQLLDPHPAGYLLIVEGARIDHAHHASNAHRALQETEEFDKAVGLAARNADLDNTLIMVTADHGHVFHIAGYPMRPRSKIPYPTRRSPTEDLYGPPGDPMSLAFFIDLSNGTVRRATDAFGVPYTVLGYGNGPGFRIGGRTDPFLDRTLGFEGATVFAPTDPNYLQEAGIPLAAETHAGSDVSVHATGRGASFVRGTIENTEVFHLLRNALGI